MPKSLVCFTFKRSIIVLFVLCLILLYVKETRAKKVGLDELIITAIEQNPSLKSLKNKVDAAYYRIPQAGSPPDPNITFGYINEGFLTNNSVGEEPMSRYQIILKQTFPFPGKLRLARKIAGKEKDVEEITFEREEIQIISDIKFSYLEAVKLKEIDEKLRSKLDILKNIEGIIAAQYANDANKNITDILDIQIEQQNVLIKMEELNKREIITLEALYRLVGKEYKKDELLLNKIEISETNFTINELMDTVLDGSNDVKILKEQLNSARLQVALKKKDMFPDFTIALSYEPRDSSRFDDVWGLSLSFNLPVFYRQKQSKGILEARSEELSLKNELTYLKYNIREKVSSYISEIETAKRIINLYNKEIISRYKDSIDASVNSYINGKTPLKDLLIYINKIYDYEILYIEKLTEHEKAIVNLWALSGGNI
jgi:outer membrane protein TolC